MRDRFRAAHARIWELELLHGLLGHFGNGGKFSSRRKDLSHFGGFDLDLCYVALHGPGDDQLKWRRWLESRPQINVCSGVGGDIFLYKTCGCLFLGTFAFLSSPAAKDLSSLSGTLLCVHTFSCLRFLQLYDFILGGLGR